MTADLPEWAMEKARQAAPHAPRYHNAIATALVSIAKAERERAAGIARAYRHVNPFPTLQDAIATAILADGGPDAG